MLHNLEIAVQSVCFFYETALYQLVCIIAQESIQEAFILYKYLMHVHWYGGANFREFYNGFVVSSSA